MTPVDRGFELDLIARLKRGEGDAFDQVFAAFNPRLFNFLARLSRRRDIAEDLLEETWLRVVAHAPRLHDDTRLAPWLFTIARNLYASYCRSRLLDYEMAALQLWPSQPAEPSPFEAAAAGELQQRVEVALASLSGIYREALLLVALEGLTPAEAATVCGVTPETMRQRLSRARSLLARRLDASAISSVRVLKEVLP
ncbi:MAG TPA: RNA polymerase sigma factor [Vicinamibacterales bacterium]|nr:RNA polymerase sigma factor [Vicinamibacterales bacterium]